MSPLVANFLAHEPVRRLETPSGEPKKRPISGLARSLPMLVRGRQEDGFWRAFAQEPMSFQVPRRLLRNACGRSACLSRRRFFLPIGKPRRLPGFPLSLFLLPARLFLRLLDCALQRSLLASLPGLGALPVALLFLPALFLQLVAFGLPAHRIQPGGQRLGSHLPSGQDPLAAGLRCSPGHHAP